VPHGFNPDPGPAPHSALPEPGDQADSAAEEPGIGTADGNRGGLQQAPASQGGLLPRSDVDQQEVDQSIRPLLKLSREMMERGQKLDYALVSSLERDPLWGRD